MKGRQGIEFSPPERPIRKDLVRIDPRYFRPTEVDELLGDQGKAHQKLGWRRTTRFPELVAEVVQSHLCMVANEPARSIGRDQ